MKKNEDSKISDLSAGMVKSAARAVDILELLVEFPRGLSLSEIRQHLSIPSSSLHSLMGTLVHKGYLTRDDVSSSYTLSYKFLQLAANFHSKLDLVSIADPVMQRLENVASEMTSLAILQDDLALIIHKRSAPNVIQVVSPVGTRLPAHASSLGKAMLAWLEEAEIDRLYPHEDLPTFTDITISKRSKLKEVLEEVRSRGFAFDNGEYIEGVWAVAAAICDVERRPVAAVSIAAPLFRINGKDVSRWCQAVASGANEISATLGFSVNSS